MLNADFIVLFIIRNFTQSEPEKLYSSLGIFAVNLVQYFSLLHNAAGI